MYIPANYNVLPMTTSYPFNLLIVFITVHSSSPTPNTVNFKRASIDSLLFIIST